MGSFCCKQNISCIYSAPEYGVKVSEQIRFIAMAGVKSDTAQIHRHTNTICKPKSTEIKIDANTDT